MHLRKFTTALLATGSALVLGASAHAATFAFKADLQTLNPDVDEAAPDADPTGVARVVYDDVAGTLTVRIMMEGVTPGQAHAQHIHGLPGADSVTPLPVGDFDTDGDGFLELAEGAPAYGPVIVPLTQDDGMGFPVADTGGSYTYERVFDVSDTSIFADGFGASDLFPLAFREIVVHGAFLPEGAGGNGGEANGSGGYVAFLPVAAGELDPVPIPGAAFLFAGAGLMGGAYRRITRKRA